MKKIKSWFINKTAEQTMTLCLLILCIVVMAFCAIVRMCGALWFTADLNKVPIPSQYWQNRIMNIFYAFELTMVYKIMSSASWSICIIIAIIQTVIMEYIPSDLAVNIIGLLLFFIIPIVLTKDIKTGIDCTFLYLAGLAYSALFLVGRIGKIEVDAAYNFVYNVVGMVDYKIFYIVIYLAQKYNGGIKIWKNQKRPILGIHQKKSAMIHQDV